MTKPKLATEFLLILEFLQGCEGSVELDAVVEIYATDRDWIQARGLPYTRTIDAAMKLIPDDWWWHTSHLEASVIPTGPAPGLEGVMSNSQMYESSGRPIDFTSEAHYDREKLPRAICIAAVKARFALTLPNPIPDDLRDEAFALLKEVNAEATWDEHFLFQYKMHWIAKALAKREANLE